MLAVQMQRNCKQRMEPGYFKLYIHGLMSTSPLSFWVLAHSAVTRARAKLSVVSTDVRKGRIASLLNFCEPWCDVFILRVLRISSWRRGDSVTASLGSREEWVLFCFVLFSNNRLGFGDRSLAFCPFVSQALFKIPRAAVLMKIQWNMKSHRHQFLNPSLTRPLVYLPNKSTGPNLPYVVCFKESWFLIENSCECGFKGLDYWVQIWAN